VSECGTDTCMNLFGSGKYTLLGDTNEREIILARDIMIAKLNAIKDTVINKDVSLYDNDDVVIDEEDMDIQSLIA